MKNIFLNKKEKLSNILKRANIRLTGLTQENITDDKQKKLQTLVNQKNKTSKNNFIFF